jgi:aminoglycoside phosphotransferase (APT) family kinase protein
MLVDVHDGCLVYAGHPLLIAGTVDGVEVGTSGSATASDDTAMPMDQVNAQAALEAACYVAGLDATGAELIRLGSNATFRLRGRPVVARVGRAANRLAEARREVAVSRWLAHEDVPAIRALDVEQPVVADGRVVTFWESASDQVEYGTVGELAVLLRRLHSLTSPADLELPSVAPFGRARQRIQAATMPDEDRRYLLDRCDQLAEAFNALTFELPPGVVHGDASVGNVIRDRDGNPLLADLDGFANGPREWDLVLTALYYENFGWHTAEEYRTFADTYGCDVMKWPGYQVLRDVREFLMVAWLSQNAGHDPEVAAELAARIEDLRTGASRHGWKPF